MQQYVFPAVFIKNEDETYTSYIPDLNLTSDGETIEEAFLFIQDFLAVYCSYAKKVGEEETLVPTKFEKIVEANKRNVVMLVDAYVK
ncbi:MAG: type II toxin-antitoxin system HicB family antitoxin [Eubacteriales bacterium]|nr:type II toxin-antitoxin system HicB family antitoxin [Eubacteriales bacterium]